MLSFLNSLPFEDTPKGNVMEPYKSAEIANDEMPSLS